MFKNYGKIGVILFSFIIALSLIFAAGCSKGPNLKGAVITVGSWSGDYDVNTYQPRNEDEEIMLEFRKKLIADNGFAMTQKELAGWDDYFQVVTSNIMSGNKDISMYWLSAEWAMTLYRQGLLYPISDSSVDLTNRELKVLSGATYNKMMEDLFTFNGKQYAFSLGQGGDSWQGNFVFWNKRLLREAGYDPDHLYNLQRDNQWTWDALHEVLRRTTRDTNNDGIVDVFGMPCDDPREVMNAFVYGNNANFVTIDSSGKFHNAITKPEFSEAMQFYLRLLEEGLMKPRPNNAAWDWDFTDFIDGRVALLIAPEWRKGQMPDSMTDDYGCVLPPMGPRANHYRMSLTENVCVIPAIFSRDEVDIILTIQDIWHSNASTDWKQGHYWAFRDRRAVDESVAMTKDARNVTYRNFALIPGFPGGDMVWNLWEFSGNPAQLIEQYTPRIQGLLDEMNQ